jgi:hypothetical protein
MLDRYLSLSKKYAHQINIQCATDYNSQCSSIATTEYDVDSSPSHPLKIPLHQEDEFNHENSEHPTAHGIFSLFHNSQKKKHQEDVSLKRHGKGKDRHQHDDGKGLPGHGDSRGDDSALAPEHKAERNHTNHGDSRGDGSALAPEHKAGHNHTNHDHSRGDDSALAPEHKAERNHTNHGDQEHHHRRLHDNPSYDGGRRGEHSDRAGPHGGEALHHIALGFGPRGDTCLADAFDFLTPNCKASLMDLRGLHDDFSRDLSSRRHDQHGPGFFEMLLFIAIIASVIAFCVRRFGFKREHRHQLDRDQMHAVIAAINSDPTLKESVESRTGLIVPIIVHQTQEQLTAVHSDLANNSYVQSLYGRDILPATAPQATYQRVSIEATHNPSIPITEGVRRTMII